MNRSFPYFSLLITLNLLVLFSSCKEEIKIDTSEFIITKDHKIELVAKEPDVILPVAMVEDSRNRFWVVEMPGYMRDINGNDEDLADGRIVILSDENHDGKIDSRKIFLNDLVNPRALCLVYNGILFSDGPMLKWAKLVDDQPVQTIVVDSFYVVGGNIEHQPNGLLYNIDNWIYSAKSNARYRRIDGEWKKEATTFRGQWGLSMDRIGRLVYNHNSAPLLSDQFLPNQSLDNPYLNLKHSTGKYLTDDLRIFPIQATSVNRGYQPDVLDSTGKVINYTSACAPHLFYGNALDPSFHGSAFVCAPEGNLIANYSYDETTQSATRSLGENEFLISNDESFRPVNLLTGFDGSLYVVDMRKGIIQHSAYMSSYLRDAITSKGLDKINGKGRIYRISKIDNVYSRKKLQNLSTKELIDLFFESNLQLRMFAQKELITHIQEGDIEYLISIAKNSENPNAKIHSLWTLEGLGKLEAELITEMGNKIINKDILAQLIVLSKLAKSKSAVYDDLYLKCLNLQSRQLDLLLATVVGQSADNKKMWLQLADRYPNDAIISEALVSSIPNQEEYFRTNIDDPNKEILKEILDETITYKKEGQIMSPILMEEPFDDDRTNGLKIFKRYCASCHGLDGKGQKNVAPSLKQSAIIDGDESVIASIILNGYTSGKGNYQILMPAYKEDTNLTDQDIYDIISYLKSTYTSHWNSIKVEDIKALR